MQNDIQKLYTGGTVFHAFIGESIDDPAMVRKLVQKIASNYELPYFTIPRLSQSVTITGILKGNSSPVPTAARKRRFTPESLVTTGRYRTGITARSRNST
jgi:ribonucleoside-triphosphate reductase